MYLDIPPVKLNAQIFYNSKRNMFTLACLYWTCVQENNSDNGSGTSKSSLCNGLLEYHRLRLTQQKDIQAS